MNWSDIGNMVAKAAPALGGLLGGPIGAGAGQLIASALGTEPTPKAIAQHLESNPDALLEMKQIELEHEQEILKLQVQEMQLMLADKQHARETHKQSRVPSILTGIIMGLILLAGIALVFATIPQGNRDMINMLVGALIGYASSANAFWFGADEQQRRSKK